ncbi:hypothetical protein B0T21DRAFT_88192 [Apiosordaria backusii]|uniref:F-box domain-containing protein n=1 Tax=Apiosordaria backusii TaxID=314023 RepID=A0AA40ERX7_9PEZI|nr:hypothetical protein B0T21DRAFT_88192 [Apiosordaria backusii]
MASLLTTIQHQDAHDGMAHEPELELEAEGEDLDPVVATQLAEKTSQLTLSTPGSEKRGSGTTDEQGAVASSSAQLPNGNPSVTHPARPPASAQPYDSMESTGILPDGQVDASTQRWQGDPSLALSTPFCPTMVDVPSTMQPSPEPESHGSIDSGSGETDQDAVALASNVPRGEFSQLPNEVLLHILSYLEVCDLLATSRVGLTPFPCALLKLCWTVRDARPDLNSPQHLHVQAMPVLLHSVSASCSLDTTTSDKTL